MSEIDLNFSNATEEYFNKILLNGNLKQNLKFEEIKSIFDKLLAKIAVSKDKKSLDYEKAKKKFSKFLNCNYKFLKQNLDVDESIIKLFNDNNKNWYFLHISINSYLSYLNQTIDNTTDINYKGMIDKLTIEIEEYSESDEETIQQNEHTKQTTESNQKEIDTNIMLDELSENTPPIMKELIDDIKNILPKNNNMESFNFADIFNISKTLSQKYEDKINSGDINYEEITSGIGNILESLSNNPQMKDIMESMSADGDAQPDMSKLLSVMSSLSNNGGNGNGNDSASQQMPNMDLLKSFMPNFAQNDNLDNKSISDLEREMMQMAKDLEQLQLQEDDVKQQDVD